MNSVLYYRLSTMLSLATTKKGSKVLVAYRIAAAPTATTAKMMKATRYFLGKSEYIVCKSTPPLRACSGF
jgi:hypothetical protein